MRSLQRRVSLLEGPKADAFAHLTDDELRERLIEVTEELADMTGITPPDGWREMIASDDPRDHAPLFKFLEELKCELSIDG